MTFSTAAALVSLFFFSSFAVAGIVAPPCNSAWSWSYNSLGQNPCLIVAYLLSTCNGGSFTVNPLTSGQSYVGPNGGQADSDLCECSTIAYSLISACDGCQGSTPISWSQFSANCTTTVPAGQFPNAIPAGTAVPQWALLDVTKGNLWNVNQSYAVGDSPEIAPGTLLGPSGPSSASSTSPTSTSSSTSSNSATPVPIRSHSSNTGAIAGGVVGGLAAISIAIAALLYYLRGRQTPTPPAPTAIDERPSGFNSLMDQVPRSMSGHGTISSDPSMPRFYDPNDPTTYPTYQGPSPPPIYPHNSIGAPSGPFPPSGKGPYVVGSAPNSQRLGPGYSGLPEPEP